MGMLGGLNPKSFLGRVIPPTNRQFRRQLERLVEGGPHYPTGSVTRHSTGYTARVDHPPDGSSRVNADEYLFSRFGKPTGVRYITTRHTLDTTPDGGHFYRAADASLATAKPSLWGFSWENLFASPPLKLNRRDVWDVLQGFIPGNPRS